MTGGSGLTSPDPNILLDYWAMPLEERAAVYVVTGFPRSGTSMMMRALVMGGIPGEYDIDNISHRELKARTGYLPNPHGYYEVGRGPEPWWYPAPLAGRVVKMELASVNSMGPGGRYRVILTSRAPEAIERSLVTYMEALDKAGIEKPQLGAALCIIRSGGYAETMMVALQHLKNRRDVEQIVEVPYEETVEMPEPLFEALAKAGWPLDVQAAASIPEKKWDRSSG